MSALMLLNNARSRVFPVLKTHALRNTIRAIANSPKNRGTAATLSESISKNTKTETEASSKKPWVSYGFDHKSESTDKNAMKASYFFSITLCLVWGTFIWSYLPDTQLRDWAQREGFLELRRREQAGLDLISPNYIDPATMKLPSDEDLGSTEIII